MTLPIDKAHADLLARIYMESPTLDELKAVLGDKWTITRNTEANRYIYGKCITSKQYAMACKTALANRAKSYAPWFDCAQLDEPAIDAGADLLAALKQLRADHAKLLMDTCRNAGPFLAERFAAADAAIARAEAAS